MQETWVGKIPALGRSPGEGNGNPLQYSCLEHSMDRGAWWATVHGVAESDMTEQLAFSLCVHASFPGFLGLTETWPSPGDASSPGLHGRRLFVTLYLMVRASNFIYLHQLAPSLFPDLPATHWGLQYLLSHPLYFNPWHQHPVFPPNVCPFNYLTLEGPEAYPSYSLLYIFTTCFLVVSY